VVNISLFKMLIKTFSWCVENFGNPWGEGRKH